MAYTKEILTQEEIDVIFVQYKNESSEETKSKTQKKLEKTDLFICMNCQKRSVFLCPSPAPYIFTHKGKCKGKRGRAYVSWARLKEIKKLQPPFSGIF